VMRGSLVRACVFSGNTSLISLTHSTRSLTHARTHSLTHSLTAFDTTPHPHTHPHHTPHSYSINGNPSADTSRWRHGTHRHPPFHSVFTRVDSPFKNAPHFLIINGKGHTVVSHTDFLHLLLSALPCPRTPLSNSVLRMVLLSLRLSQRTRRSPESPLMPSAIHRRSDFHQGRCLSSLLSPSHPTLLSVRAHSHTPTHLHSGIDGGVGSENVTRARARARSLPPISLSLVIHLRQPFPSFLVELSCLVWFSPPTNNIRTHTHILGTYRHTPSSSLSRMHEFRSGVPYARTISF
jgi:hypothetical protein